MALQLHRSFASGGLYGSLCAPSRLSIMQSQCKGLQNYSGICLPYSLYCSGAKHGKLAHLSFRKAGEVCRMTRKQLKDLRYMVERDSYFNNSTYIEYKIGATAILPAQPYVSLPYANHYKSFFTPSCMESRLSFSTSSKERGSRRFFSVKATASKIGGNTSFFKDFDVFQEKTKSFAVRSSNPDAYSQVAVSTQPVKKTVSSTSKKSVSRNSPKDIGGDKKDNKSKSSVATVTENNSRKHEPKAEGKIGADRKDNKSKSSVSAVTENSSQEPKTEVKKKQQKNRKQVKLPVSTASSGEAKAKQATQLKKSGLDKADQTSQPSETKKSLTKKKSTKPKAPKHNTPAVLVQVNGMPHKTLEPLYPPSGKSVVVVESVTKAKVIQGYLGDMFEVLPSYGHVRDLAGRSGSVRPDEEFSMVWEVPTAAWTHLKSIKVALNGAKNLILASDPDREGEAIAWHIMEMLQQQEALHKDITVARVVFHEITESSIKSALQTPRDIDANLVHAYLARRALDYLIGFSISPLLWRKLPACQSAGRVQSAALALICDREMEIDEFKPQEYWSVKVDFKKNDSDELLSLPSHLTHCGSKKLEQLSISSDGEARNIEKKITSSCFEVVGSKRSKARKNPPAPYITSTLQQDASNKLHFSASYTMKLAQKLYEGVKLSDKEATGLITYMRTDGLHVSDAATKDIRSLVTERYGHDFASESTRKYYKKVKNAQEAHEAIRPTNIWKLPSMLTGVLDEDSLKLYTLIWSRTLACQMEPSVIDQIQVDIGDAEKSLIFRSTCSKVQFLGYQVVYKDLEVAATGYNEKEGDANDEIFEVLSTLKLGDPLQLGKVELKQHSTQPSSRYSEASLVKKLEELGIGRPSTYASTIKVLKDRNYVTTKSRVLYPEFRGRMVSAFLSHHFSEVTDYSFTADMEAELDNVSAGITEWKGLLKDYWTRFSTYCDNAATVDIRQVEKMLEETFGHFLFSSLPDKSRTCPSCSVGNLIFKVSRFGAGYFIGCDQHPTCKYIAKMIYANNEDDEPPKKNDFFSEPKLLGLHPGSSEKILLKNGPYGFYVQLGEDRNGYLPKRASASQIKDVDSITVEDALDLLRYPIKLGNHPDDSEPVYIKIAKHGFSIRHRRTIAPVPKNTDPKDITFEKALQFLLSKDAKKCGRPKNKPKREDAF